MLIVTSDAHKQMVEFGFACRFHNLNYFEVGIFFHIPCLIIFFHIHYVIKGIITKVFGKPSIECNSIVFLTNFRQSIFQYDLLAQHLSRRLKYIDFSLKNLSS